MIPPNVFSAPPHFSARRSQLRPEAVRMRSVRMGDGVCMLFIKIQWMVLNFTKYLYIRGN